MAKILPTALVLETEDGYRYGMFVKSEGGDYFTVTGERGRPACIPSEDVIAVYTQSEAERNGILVAA